MDKFHVLHEYLEYIVTRDSRDSWRKKDIDIYVQTFF